MTIQFLIVNLLIAILSSLITYFFTMRLFNKKANKEPTDLELSLIKIISIPDRITLFQEKYGFESWLGANKEVIWRTQCRLGGTRNELRMSQHQWEEVEIPLTLTISGIPQITTKLK